MALAEQKLLLQITRASGGSIPLTTAVSEAGLLRCNVFFDKDDRYAAAEDKEFQTSGAQYSTDINSAQPGDAIFFSNDSNAVVHVGVVVDVKDGVIYFIHEPGKGRKADKGQMRMNNLIFDKKNHEKFAGLGRPIENGSPAKTTKPSSGPTIHYDGLYFSLVSRSCHTEQVDSTLNGATTSGTPKEVCE